MVRTQKIAPPYPHLMHLLRDRRRDAGLTQAEAAKLVGVTQQTYGNYEIGSLPRPGTANYSDIMEGLARFLRVSVPDLILLCYATESMR